MNSNEKWESFGAAKKIEVHKTKQMMRFIHHSHTHTNVLINQVSTKYPLLAISIGIFDLTKTKAKAENTSPTTTRG